MTAPRVGRETRREDRTSSFRWSERLVEAGVLFLLGFTPLAFGTVEPWSEATAELVVLGMVVVWLLGMLRDWEIRVELPPAWLPASLFLALIFLQATPLPRALTQVVSPWTAGFYDQAMAYTRAEISSVPLSLAPHDTWREALKLGAVAAFFLVCYNVYRTRAQVRRAVWTMIVVGATISLFGVVQRVTWNGRFYWFGPEAPHRNAFGPFVNRAHFAGLIVIIVPMALALWLGSRVPVTRKRLIRTWGDRLRVWNSNEAGSSNLIPLLVLVMGGAALVSGSRGGVVALLGALLALIGLELGGPTGMRGASRLVFLLGLVVLAGVWISGETLYGTSERLVEEVQQPQESPRLRLWRNALQLVLENPLIGTGYSTFGLVYPAIRSIQAPLTFSHPESDWMEMLSGTGILGAGLIVAATVWTVSVVLRDRRREERWIRSLKIAGAVAFMATAVHGVVNYSLPVTSTWVYLIVVLVVAGRAGSMSARAPRPSPAVLASDDRAMLARPSLRTQT